MRALWTIFRIAIGLLALVVLVLTAAFSQSPSGTAVILEGVALDAAALVVLVAMAWSLFHDRRHLI